MKPRILLIPDWLGWITGTEAKAIKAYNPQFDCDIVPMAALRHAIGCGWKPELDFDAVHLFTTETVREFGPRFLGKLPTVTSMHHVHDEADVVLDVSGDAIMTGSSPWETDLIRRGVPREKLIRLAYGVDCRKFRPPSVTERLVARRGLRLHHNEVAVGFVGKKGSDNVGRKGFDIYCEAIRRLVMAGVPCVALVLGSGWQEELRKSLPSAVRHIHLPYMKDPSLIYRAMDFYWVCSRIEGGPVPLLEAMATGVPCVCRNVGMVRDAITSDKEGIAFDEGTPAEFAAETRSLWTDRPRYEAVSKAARGAMVDRFRWAITVRPAARLYRAAFREFATRAGRPAPSDLPQDPTEIPAEDKTLDMVPTMVSLPAAWHTDAALMDSMSMVHELFRVKNKVAASKLSAELCLRYPRKLGQIASINFKAWIAPCRMTLGRWRGQLAGVLSGKNNRKETKQE
jgi:glycosyltransferase involved in cell wall biosynthesis